MSKWLWIPITLLVAFAGDRLLGALLRGAALDSQFRYSRLYNGTGAADVVLLGNSRGLNFYQPFIEERTGRSTLNLSYNAMPVDVGAALLEDYLDRYGAPAKLVVDVTFLDRDNDDLVRDFRVYAQFSERLDSLLRERDPAIWGGTKVSHLTRYGGEVGQRMFYYLTRSDEDWLLDRQIAEKVVEASAALEPYRNGYKLRRIERLAEVVDDYRAAGTDVRFVINPYYPAFRESIVNLDSLSIDVRGITGVDVLDYSRSVRGDENFGDLQHLNKRGAEVYLARLIEDIGL